MTEKNVPSELILNKKWDWAVSEFGVRMAVGTAAAGIAAVDTTRGPRMRVAITTFGTGFGAGWAYKIVDDSFANVSRK